MWVVARSIFLPIAIAVWLSPANAQEQEIDIGQHEYLGKCAICHGTSGKGDGSYAAMLKQKVPDLTNIRKNNNGIFPFNRIYNVIDGREMVAAHGTRDMPIWGREYTIEAPAQVGSFGTSSGPFGISPAYRSFVRGRILALIGYLDTLQDD